MNFSSYSVYKVRETLQQFKKGSESITLTFGPIKTVDDPDLTPYESVGVKGVTLKGKAG